ncbi:hypothetical protein [Actinacidiphila epipremni]|uniref:Uncharacterized protein n=1 Tax=Actinacidiphila epipremni TaxID=2053013 RepID=A0ABX1A3F2_9ACTN|nr:hypothetical protein [Actinacidiphila epipremni]NJP48301.1 hypothetical protein [Actinacidiphila epipremni]
MVASTLPVASFSSYVLRWRTWWALSLQVSSIFPAVGSKVSSSPGV